MTDTYELPEPGIQGSTAPGMDWWITPAPDGDYFAAFTADQMKEYARLAVKAERERFFAALQAEIDHCAVNDIRTAPPFGRSKGEPAVPVGYVQAVMERFAIRKG